MTPSDLARELLRPFTDSVLLIAIGVFGAALWLSLVIMQSGPLLVIFGLFIALLVLGTLFRYAVQVLECRAQGLRTPVVDIDAVSLFGNLWTLSPLLLVIAFVWGALYLNGTGNPGAAIAVSVLLALLLPASTGVLAITHSPLESIKPSAIYRLIERCGAGYAWIPIVIAALLLASAGMARAGAPLLPIVLLRTYVIILLFTLTGEVVRRSGVFGDVSVGLPQAGSEPDYHHELTADRRKVADHAYGFISRGNREGGFKHIRQSIAVDPDPDAAVQWFFDEMLRWESKDAALFFGQECLAHLLHHDQDARALKLMSRCIHESPAWRPRAEDRQAAIELAKKYSRDDLLPSLRS